MALQKQRFGKDHGVKSLLLVEHPLPLIEKNLKKLKNGVERDMEVLKSLLKALNVDVVSLLTFFYNIVIYDAGQIRKPKLTMHKYAFCKTKCSSSL